MLSWNDGENSNNISDNTVHLNSHLTSLIDVHWDNDKSKFLSWLHIFKYTPLVILLETG